MSTIFGYLCSTPVSAASLTLTVPSAPISLDINPSASGTFSKSAAAQIKVKTDAFAGYTLSIKAKDSASDNNLISGTNKLASITEAAGLSEDVYKGAGHNNTWGYQPSKLNNGNNANFLPGPTTSPSVIEKTTAANASSDNNYGLTIAAKIDNTFAAGAYNNIFVLEAIANSVSYTFTYELNGGGNPPSPNPQTGSTTENTAKLSSTTPTRNSYEFLGWCSEQPVNNSSSNPTCSGQTYQAGANVTLTNGNNQLTFYAMWKSSTVSYNIQYNTNGGEPTSMAATTGTALPSASVALDSTEPTYCGYAFNGWCSVNNSSNKASCSGNTYQAGASYPLSKGANVTLYAIWVTPQPCSAGTVTLKDGKKWCKKDATTCAYWADAKTICNQGSYRLPTMQEFFNLVLAYFPNADTSASTPKIYTANTNGNANINPYYYKNFTPFNTFATAWGSENGVWWSNEIVQTQGDSQYGGVLVFRLESYSASINAGGGHNIEILTNSVRCISN